MTLNAMTSQRPPVSADMHLEDYPWSIDHMLARAAALWPDHAGLSDRKETKTFAQLEGEVSCLAAWLRDWLPFARQPGTPPPRVGVYVRKDVKAVVALLATLRAGMVAVPINPALKAEQVQYLIKDSQMAGLIMPESVHASAPDIFDIAGLQTLFFEDQPEKATLELSPHPECDAAPDDLALLLYTSGSTGRPKGVMLSHRNVVLGAVSVASYLKLTPQDCVLAVLPFSFDYGLNQLTSALHSGAHVVLHEFFLAPDVVKLVEKHDVTGLAGVPPLWHLMCDADWPQQIGARLRYVTNSGGKMSPALQERLRAQFPKADIFAMYGLTEAFRSTYLPPAKLADKPHSIGKAIDFADVFVVSEDGALCPQGVPGELVHTGPLVAQGYWNDRERTAKRFRAVPDALKPHVDPAFHARCVFSGDTVQRDADGDLSFVGRNDDMIKSMGHRISPHEIEDVLVRLPQVSEVAAFGLADERLGQRICVVVTPGADAADIEGSVKAYARTHLPNFAQPHHVEVRESLPRSPNGKVDRPTLKSELDQAP